jgi:hypothetical protein
MLGPSGDLLIAPALSLAFIERIAEPCGYWSFSTARADKVQDKGPRTTCMGLAVLGFPRLLT